MPPWGNYMYYNYKWDILITLVAANFYVLAQFQLIAHIAKKSLLLQ